MPVMSPVYISIDKSVWWHHLPQ